MDAQRHVDAQVLELHLLLADEIERRPNDAMSYARKILSHWNAVATARITVNGQACSITVRPLSFDWFAIPANMRPF